MLPQNWSDDYKCKNKWSDKPFKAICPECEAVIHGGESEDYCNQRAREHANILGHEVSVRMIVEDM